MNNELQQAINCFLEAYQTAKEIGYVEILADFEDLAKIEDWERLSQQIESGEKPRGTTR